MPKYRIEYLRTRRNDDYNDNDNDNDNDNNFFENPIVEEVTVDKQHYPTKILVHSMSGTEYILATSKPNETYGDLKKFLLPYISPQPKLHQIVFRRIVRNIDIDYYVVEDTDNIPTSEKDKPIIIELEIIINERVWTDDEKIIINLVQEGRAIRGGVIFSKSRIGNDLKEAFLWALQEETEEGQVNSLRIDAIDMIELFEIVRSNPNIKTLNCSFTPRFVDNLDYEDPRILIPCVKTLEIGGVWTSKETVMNIVRANPTIETLIIKQRSQNPFTPGEMDRLFEIIKTNNTLHHLNVIRDDAYPKNTYRMNSLIDLLRNTALLSVKFDANVIIEPGDIERLKEVLALEDNPLKELSLSLDENNGRFLDSFQTIPNLLLELNQNLVTIIWEAE